MENQDHIFFIENDEISLFLAESLLEGLEFSGKAHYFTDVEEALNLIKTLDGSTTSSLSLLIGTRMLMGEKELVQQFKALLSKSRFPSMICLLSSMEGPSREEEEFIEQVGVSCTIEKPLTEEKLTDALELVNLIPSQGKR